MINIIRLLLLLSLLAGCTLELSQAPLTPGPPTGSAGKPTIIPATIQVLPTPQPEPVMATSTTTIPETAQASAFPTPPTRIATLSPTKVPDKTKAATKEDDFPIRFNEFEYLPNPDGFSRPYDTAREALQKKYGAASSKYVGSVVEDFPAPFSLDYLPFKHNLLRTSGIRYTFGNSFYDIPPRRPLKKSLFEKRDGKRQKFSEDNAPVFRNKHLSDTPSIASSVFLSPFFCPLSPFFFFFGSNYAA